MSVQQSIQDEIDAAWDLHDQEMECQAREGQKVIDQSECLCGHIASQHEFFGTCQVFGCGCQRFYGRDFGYPGATDYDDVRDDADYEELLN
ncbi:MAG: hypothetical protein US96_C0001G0030 [Candidatus Woesebacteria bacterium GW2011_GWB1_38_5b]|uniref:Uncharacterized protein n=1 Tax=Candidatus Woesebacteria bacterium GW2011_GWB1_38_5b TaxID=1618569 RepID=A0A0G0MQL1_9BACT|nr:MAG: hypothetical protein US96_C0001G0030 [Candidatus Woesebacteria bacterium GW2011_GWB1_38_5b]